MISFTTDTSSPKDASVFILSIAHWSSLQQAFVPVKVLLEVDVSAKKHGAYCTPKPVRWTFITESVNFCRNQLCPVVRFDWRKKTTQLETRYSFCKIKRNWKHHTAVAATTLTSSLSSLLFSSSTKCFSSCLFRLSCVSAKFVRSVRGVKRSRQNTCGQEPGGWLKVEFRGARDRGQYKVGPCSQWCSSKNKIEEMLYRKNAILVAIPENFGC